MLMRAGGTPETQREFLESVATDPTNNRRPPDRGRKPPIANQFALGYTYQDVLDTDHEGTRSDSMLRDGTDSCRYDRSPFSISPRKPVAILHAAHKTVPESSHAPAHASRHLA